MTYNPHSSRSTRLDLLFFTAFALIVCHELDAVTQSEWHLLPFLSQLNDELAYPIFVLGHVPLVTVLMWLTGHPCEKTRRRSQLAVDGFLVFHAIAHFSYRHHELYTFDHWVSKLCIFGSALVGITHGMIKMSTKVSSDDLEN